MPLKQVIKRKDVPFLSYSYELENALKEGAFIEKEKDIIILMK